MERLSERGVQATIHGLSNIPHEEIPIWLNAADVVLLTSKKDEGSPNIVKEALACNRPVVSLDVGDVAERIEGVQGCHVTAEDAIAIADGLFRVYEGPRVVNARKRIEGLSLEHVAEQVVEVYQIAQEGFAKQD